MMASEMIAKLQVLTKDGDREIEFLSYEWTEDLEEQEYQERYLTDVKRHKGKVRIRLG